MEKTYTLSQEGMFKLLNILKVIYEYEIYLQLSEGNNDDYINTFVE